MEIDDSAKLEFLEIGAARGDAELCVILMHGLGADGYDFEDLAELLCRTALPKRWRIVLPHATELPVTINMGVRMPAWYDILGLSHPREVNWETVEASTSKIESLIATEPAGKLILAGFSQGAAMALHVGLRNPSKVSAVAMMSGYLLESDERPVPPLESDLPIGIFHGSADEVVPFQAAEMTLQALSAAGYAPTFKPYPGLAHSVSDEEIRDLFQWLLKHGL